MNREYQKPEVEVVSLVSEEITNGLIDGEIRVESIPDGDDFWDN